jgi:hypothetical protein
MQKLVLVQLCQLNAIADAMKSVPSCGSGWVPGISILRFTIADWPSCQASIEDWQLTIGNQQTHPLPRGGTDLMAPLLELWAPFKFHQDRKLG